MDTPRELEEMSKGTIKADASALKGFDDGEKRDYLKEAYAIAARTTILLPQEQHIDALVQELKIVMHILSLWTDKAETLKKMIKKL